MRKSVISALVAPHMGNFDDGIARFKGLKPPYVRGGGIPATEYLEAQCAQYLGKWKDPGQHPVAPFVAIAASGQAANHLVFKALHGGDLVSSKHLFGTTKVDLAKTFKRAGGKIAYVDPGNVQAFIDNTTSTTTAWFLEAVSNPAGRVADLSALSKAARERNILLVVDMTLAAGMPAYFGLEYADVLTVSLTKQAGGGDNQNVGGAVIVNPEFPWLENTHRFPELREYFADAAGNLVLPPSPFGGMVSKVSLHEGSGALAPSVSISIGDKLPSMDARVQKQCANARMLADILKDHAKVKSVQLAGYATDDTNDQLALNQLGGNHFVLLVDLKDKSKAAGAFINADEFDHAVALGQKVTAISHPASSTHRQYTPQELADMGIYEGTIRISVGTEAPKVLRQKMLRALEA